MRFIFYVESFYCEIVVEYKKKSKNKKKKVYGLLTSVSHISVEKAI